MGVDVPAQRCAAVVGCPSTDRGQLSFAVRRLSSAPALAVACWKLIWPWAVFSLKKVRALVAQPDRAPDFESGGREFESLRARQVSRAVVYLSARWADPAGFQARRKRAIILDKE